MSSRKPTVFLDSSVLFSALLSKKGASAEIILLAMRGEIAILISDYVAEEVKRSLKRKAQNLLSLFEALLRLNVLKIVSEPTQDEVAHARLFISDAKDAPVIAAARKHRARYLVTLDRRDFLADDLVAQKSGLVILLPKDFLKRIRKRVGV